MSKDIVVEHAGDKTIITQKMWVEEYGGQIRLTGHNFEGFSDHVVIGATTVTAEVDYINLIELRDMKIEMLNGQIELNRASAARKEDELKDAIQALMCLEAQ